MYENANYLTCRICLEDGVRKDFIAPCACAGSQKWIHRACLDGWRSAREDRAFSQCTECHFSYKMIFNTNDTANLKCGRNTRYFCYVLRDFFLVLFLAHVAIGLLGGLVFLMDFKKAILIHYFKMTSHPIAFYYVVSLILLLSLIGLVFSFIPMEEVELSGCTCSQCGGHSRRNRCADFGNCRCDGCHHGNSSTGPCICCDTAGGCNCTGCGQCTCAECGCAGATGEGAAMVAITMVLLFAALGIFYCLAMGAYYVKQVTQRHLHVLELRNLTEEYLVADLAEGALPVDFRSPGSNSMVVDFESGEDHEGAIEMGNRSTLLNVNQYMRLSNGADRADNAQYTELNSSIVQPSAPPTAEYVSAQEIYVPPLPWAQQQELTRMGLF